MRYSKEHKAESRARILESARRLARRDGFGSTSIDEVMAGADLTRGAFYAHFDSKDELAQAVLAIRSGLENELEAASTGAQPRSEAEVVLARYLAPDQRADVARACPLVAHPVDAIRGGPDIREAYTEHLHGVLRALDEVLAETEARPSSAAVRIAVLAIGGALLSGACADEATADLIGRVCSDHISTELGGP